MEHAITDTWLLNAPELISLRSIIGHPIELPAKGSQRASIPGATTPINSLVAYSDMSRERRRIESFIRKEFFEHFDARIKRFMPVLVGHYDGDGSVSAAVGCRSAAEEPLFLETYTKGPIEELMAQKLGVHVDRNAIVEVGNLACRNASSAISIVQALVPYLLDAGFSWVVFTGAETVVRVFRRLRLMPQHLCAADKAMLSEDERRAWGSYYDYEPIVMAGRLLDGITTLNGTAGVQ